VQHFKVPDEVSLLLGGLCAAECEYELRFSVTTKFKKIQAKSEIPDFLRGMGYEKLGNKKGFQHMGNIIVLCNAEMNKVSV